MQQKKLPTEIARWIFFRCKFFFAEDVKTILKFVLRSLRSFMFGKKSKIPKKNFGAEKWRMPDVVGSNLGFT